MKKNIDFEEINLKLDELEKENCKLVTEKIKIYNLFLSELEVVSFFISNGIYFKHPDYDELSIRGPILHKDELSNKLYVYDLEDSFIKKINMHNLQSESEKMTPYNYFKNYNFDIAMKGLLSLEEYLIQSIDENQERNKQCKNSLEKYKEMLNE